MNPGPELDKLIAEKVMMWKLRSDSEWVDPSGNILPRDFIPHYSTDISAAWEIVEKVGMGPHFKMCGLDFGDGANGFGVEFGSSDSRVMAETAPHAICLAALKAVGHKF